MSPETNRYRDGTPKTAYSSTPSAAEKVCFIHARGFPYPHVSIESQGGCRFSHGEAVVPFRHYPHNNSPGQGPITDKETRMLTEVEMLSAYTAAEDGTDTKVTIS